MIVLDTNVVSELSRPSGSQAVVDWVDAQAVTELVITAITAAEIRAGVALLPPGRRQREIEARMGGPGDVTVRDLGPVLTVRAWQDGDRMRPAGVGGSKSLQDLFTDRKVPRALRRTLPVHETSARSGEGVESAFADIASRLAA